MALPSLGETYSLLADVRTSEFKRQREEERQYRKDLRRDQLKASVLAPLIGAVVNPLAKQVTAGISDVISDKFGNKYEKFLLTNEKARQYAKDKKEGITNYEALKTEAEAIKNFGGDKQAYFFEKIAPQTMSESFTEKLRLKYGNKVKDVNSVFMKGVIPALAKEHYNQGNTEDYDAWAARHIAYENNEVFNPETLKVFEKKAKRLFPKGMFGSFINFVTGRSLKEVTDDAIKVMDNPSMQFLNQINNLEETYNKTKKVDLEQIGIILDESKVIEQYRVKNQVEVSKTITYETGPEGEVKVQENTKTEVTYPYGKRVVDADGNVELLTKDIIEDKKELNTQEQLEEKALEISRKNSGSFITNYARLTEFGKRAFSEIVGGDQEVANIFALAQSGFIKEDGSAVPIEKIFEYRHSLGRALAGKGHMSGKVEDQVFKSFNIDAQMDGLVKVYKNYVEQAKQFVNAGNYPSIEAAFADKNGAVIGDTNKNLFQLNQEHKIKVVDQINEAFALMTQIGVSGIPSQ